MEINKAKWDALAKDADTLLGGGNVRTLVAEVLAKKQKQKFKPADFHPVWDYCLASRISPQMAEQCAAIANEWLEARETP